MHEPVIVVGAGPAGLASALMLARHRVPLRVVDARPGPTDRSGAPVLWRGALAALDAEIPFERLATRHPAVHAARIGLPGGGETELPMRAPAEALPSGLFVPQAVTERTLEQALAARGVRVERDTLLTGFIAGEDGVTCTLETPSGAETAYASWLVGCDGADSTVRRVLGLAFPPEGLERRWLIGDLDADTDRSPDHHLIRVAQSPEGAVVVLPVAPGRWRVAADLGRPGAGPAPADAELLARALRERAGAPWTVSACHWLSETVVAERQVSRYVHGRVVLVGEAAHRHSPAGGLGMTTAIEDAANLAWKVALELAGLPGRLVETYHEERHPAARMLIGIAGRLLRGPLASGMSSAAREALVPAALSLPADQRRVSGMFAEDGVDHRRGPLADGRARLHHAGSGDPFPDVPVMSGGALRSSYRLLRGAEATLLLLGGAPGPAEPRLGGPEGIPVTVRRVGPGGDAEDPEGRLAEALGDDHCAVLVRPDGVIATVARSGEATVGWLADRLAAVA